MYSQGSDLVINLILLKNSKKTSKNNIASGFKSKLNNQLVKPFFIAAILALVLVSEVFSTTLSVEDFVADATLFDVALSPNGKYLAEIVQ